jgi:hypothetical protein
MKKRIFLFVTFVFLAFVTNATVITVNNNTDGGAQYSALQTAIDAANPGDTILVSGSITSYGNITIDRQLVLIGAGYNNPFGQSSSIGSLDFQHFSDAVFCNNSSIQGFIISSIGFSKSPDYQNKTYENITILRCDISNISIWGTRNAITTLNNVIYINCLVKNTIGLCNYDGGSGMNINSSFVNWKFKNCIMDNVTFTLESVSYSNNYSVTNWGITIENSVFINKSTNIFDRIGDITLNNNIFYSAEPHGATGAVYNNNITYICVDNTIPGSSNVGSGNIIDQNPLFENYPHLGGAFSYDYDFDLQAGSPAIDAGTDGSDIGISGGSFPFEVGANPSIPQMTEITFPDNQSSVPLGGSLNVNFKATKQD